MNCTDAIILSFAAVAQLDRVLGYEPRGRGFDSCQPHHYFSNEYNGLAPQVLARFILSARLIARLFPALLIYDPE